MDILMYGVAIAAIIFVVVALIKKMDIKIILFTTGILLMYVAILMGRGIATPDFEGTGFALFDPLLAVADEFKGTLTSAGFVILVLGGYTSYMTKIGANDATVDALMKPLKRIRSPYLLVPAIFLLGNLMSLVIPSASNLSIILLATLYPVMKAAGMTTLTIAGVLATTATVMPTPLGADNVAIASELANHPEFAGLSVSEYVFSYHVIVSVPTLILMAIVHYFWQKYRDNKDPIVDDDGLLLDEDEEKAAFEGTGGMKFIYSLLPVMPILILLFIFFINTFTTSDISLGVEVVTIFSLILAILVEMAKSKDTSKTIKDTNSFFNGMGNAMDIVALLVAAGVFVVGLQSIGIIETLQNAMVSVEGSSFGFVLPLILVLLTIVIVLVTGSGTALFYAMVPLMVPLAEAANINPIAVTVPMGLAGNLMRAVSPVAAVVMIVSGTTNKTPIEIVKRTSVPMIAGLIFMFVLSMILFL